MPPPTFPRELIDQVIDELGSDAYRDHGCADAYEALHACALVSKSWTHRSRTHLFKEVDVGVREDHPTPPAPILPYVKDLEIWCGHQHGQVASVKDLLKPFAAAPIEFLGINNGLLVDQRACIQEFINAHSTTLETVQLRYCLISAYNIADIVLGCYCLESLDLVRCSCEKLPPPGRPLITDTPEPDSHFKAEEVELSLTECPRIISAMVARLPYKFGGLDIEHHAVGHRMTNALIKAHAGVLWFLRVRILAEDLEIEVKAKHLPSLKYCLNLSELTLDMEGSQSCAVRDSIFILSTVNPARSSRLGEIVLEVRYVSGWFNKEGPIGVKGEEGEDEKEDWEGLDTVLSRLAKASISMREQRLAFILVVLNWFNNKELVSTTRKWLPKLLPRFNELGSLHVHYERYSLCQAVDDNCLYRDKPDRLI